MNAEKIREKQFQRRQCLIAYARFVTQFATEQNIA